METSSVDEVEFLRDQVQRLEVCLVQYQEKFRPIETSDKADLPARKAPWNSNYEILSPLLVEYDRSISELAEDNEQLRTDFTMCKKTLDKVVAENRRLSSEKKELVEKELDNLEDRTGARQGLGDDTILNLQQQLNLALQEKESVLEMCRVSSDEVERLEREVNVMRDNPQWKMFQQQTSQVKERYYHSVNDLTEEVSKLQDELRRSKSDHRTAQVQVADLRQTLDEIRQQLNLQQKAHHAAVGEGVIFQEEKEMAKKTIGDIETRMFNFETEIERTRVENASLSDTCKDLQAKCVDLEQKEYEASLQVRDSIQLVENAILERDQVRIHEHQLLEENDKLQDAINKILDEAGVRTKEEVDNVRTMCNLNLERLTEELYQMEMENSEKISQIERLIRDKKSLETELEKCYNEGLSRGTKDSNNLAELTRRACQAETEREDALIKFENLQNQMKRFEIGRKQETQQLKCELDQLKDRHHAITGQLEKITQERLDSQSVMDGLKKQLQQSNKERDASERKWTRELCCIEKEQSLKEREFTVKLQSIEDTNLQSMMELRRHLNAQQKVSAKWKVECESLTQEFEKKLSNLRNEGLQMKRRNNELINLLTESHKKTEEAKSMLSEYTRNVKRMEDRVREAEQRAVTARKMARPRQTWRPHTPTDHVTNGSPVPMYGLDDILNGTSH